MLQGSEHRIEIPAYAGMTQLICREKRQGYKVLVL